MEPSGPEEPPSAGPPPAPRRLGSGIARIRGDGDEASDTSVLLLAQETAGLAPNLPPPGPPHTIAGTPASLTPRVVSEPWSATVIAAAAAPKAPGRAPAQRKWLGSVHPLFTSTPPTVGPTFDGPNLTDDETLL